MTTTIRTITGVLEDTAKEISFSQLKSLLTGTGLTTVQAFQITNGTGTLEYYSNIDGGGWYPVPPDCWITKAGVIDGPINSMILSNTNLNLRWTPAEDANSQHTDGSPDTPITAFNITAATAIGAPIGDILNVTADVIALNDAPVLSAVDDFAGHAGIGKAFTVQDLLNNSEWYDVDNTDNELTFKIDTIQDGTGSGKGKLTYANTANENGKDHGSVKYGDSWYIAGDVVEPDTLLSPDDVVIWTPDVDQQDVGTHDIDHQNDGILSFTVTAWDGQLESWDGNTSYTGQVNPIDVQFDVATPDAVYDNVTIIEDTTTTILASELLDSDFGAGETLKIREVHLVAGTEHFDPATGISVDNLGNKVWLNASGNVEFQPAPDSQTTDDVALGHTATAPSFTYVIETESYANIATEDLPLSMTGTVTVGITAVDDAPTADIDNTGTVVIANASTPVNLIGSPSDNINDKIHSIIVNDVDTDTITVHLSVINGVLSATWQVGVSSVVSDFDGAELTISGTINAIQAELETLKYTQDGTADDDLFISVSSGPEGTVLTTAEQHISLQIGPDDNAPPAFDFQDDAKLDELTHETYATLTDPLFILNTGTGVLGTPNLALFKSTDVDVSIAPIVEGDNSIADLVLTYNQHTLTLEDYTGDLKGDKIQFLDGSTLQYEDGSNGGNPAKSVLYGTANPDHLILNFASTAGGTLKGYMDADKLEGSAGRDVLYGGDGDDRIVGYGGNDYLNGGHGDDTFVFKTNNDGSDVIADFTSGSDKLYLPFTPSVVVSQSGSDTLITIDANNSIRLMGVNSTNNNSGVITSAITLDNFELYGSDTINISSILVGTSGLDSILAGTGSDTIIGGLGADSIDLDDADGDVVIKYNTSRESTLDSVDRISHLVLDGNSADTIDLPGAGVDTIVPSQLITALDEKSINDFLNSVNGTASNKFQGSVATDDVDVAVLTTDDINTFLAIDLDGNGAFSAATDMLIEITGAQIAAVSGGSAGITSDSFI